MSPTIVEQLCTHRIGDFPETPFIRQSRWDINMLNWTMSQSNKDSESKTLCSFYQQKLEIPNLSSTQLFNNGRGHTAARYFPFLPFSVQNFHLKLNLIATPLSLFYKHLHLEIYFPTKSFCLLTDQYLAVGLVIIS